MADEWIGEISADSSSRNHNDVPVRLRDGAIELCRCAPLYRVGRVLVRSALCGRTSCGVQADKCTRVTFRPCHSQDPAEWPCWLGPLSPRPGADGGTAPRRGGQLRAGTLDKRSRTVDRDRDKSHPLGLGPNVAEKPSENVSSGHLLQEDIQRRLRLCIAVSLLPLVLYWYETRSATLREEHRLRVFENGVPGEEEG
jgi:hypothetical protein